MFMLTDIQAKLKEIGTVREPKNSHLEKLERRCHLRQFDKRRKKKEERDLLVSDDCTFARLFET